MQQHGAPEARAFDARALDGAGRLDSSQPRDVPDPLWGLTPSERSALDPSLDRALHRASPQLRASVHRVLVGGKRLRPSLTIAAAGQRGRSPVSPAVLSAAAAVELMHCATLIHDDLIDDAQSRHGAPTINARDGLTQAVLGGDLLIAASIGLAARAGADAAALMADTLTALCVGQSLEDTLRYCVTTGEADALAVARGKTGSLLGAAARLGAMVAGFDPVVVDALETFGSAFGTSLQLVDDVLDLASTDDLLGKPVLADFPAGTISLPAVIALAGSAELRELVRPGLSEAERARAAHLLRASGGIEYTVREAAREADAAESALSDVAGDDAALGALARWPRLYLDAQLQTKTEPCLAQLTALDAVRAG